MDFSAEFIFTLTFDSALRGTGNLLLMRQVYTFCFSVVHSQRIDHVRSTDCSQFVSTGFLPVGVIESCGGVQH